MSIRYVFAAIMLVIIFNISWMPVSSSPKRNHHKSNKVVHIFHPLTKAQRTAGLRAVKALHKLEVATEIGTSFNDYNTRLIDVKIDVDEETSTLSDGPLKREINFAMSDYEQAKTLWADLLQKYSSDDETSRFMSSSEFIMATLSDPWQDARTHIGKAEAILK